MTRPRRWWPCIGPGLTTIVAATFGMAPFPGACQATGTGSTGLSNPGFLDEPPGHGRITLGYQSAFTRGVVNESGDDFLPNAKTDTQALVLGIDYRLSDRWMLHAALPFIRKRARDYPPAHNPTRLANRHPESEFLDDGQYHGAWQDWQLGVSYHTQWRGFDVVPHAFLVYPSHDYTFFAAAAVGQNLKRLRLGADVSRRLGRTNFHYSAGYSYELVEEVLGYNLDKQYVRVSGWYDFSPQFSASLYANGQWSGGLKGSFFPAEARRGSELWYQHDRLLQQNYAIAGVSADWRPTEAWSLSASVGQGVLSQSLQRLRHAYSVQVSRNF